MGSFCEWMLESSLLVIMIVGIRKIFMGRIRYAGIYALWIVVLLRFLIPVNFISTPFSAAKIASDAISAIRLAETSAKDEGAAVTAGKDVQWKKVKGVPFEGHLAEEVSKNNQQINGAMAREENNEVKQAADEAQKNEEEAHAGAEDLSFWRMLCRVWFIVFVLLFLWLLLCNNNLSRKLKRSRILYGERDGVKIYAVNGTKTPCLYGFVRPAVYLPASLVSGSAGIVGNEEIEQMITHELVHYHHRDHIWAAFRMFLAAVYWFDPFMWIAVSLSKKDAELFCDETVVCILGEEKRFSYGEMLVRLAGSKSWGDFRYPVVPMSRKGREMERRIRAIGEKKRYSKWAVIPLVMVLSFAGGVTCSSGIPFPERGEKPADSQAEAVGVKKAADSGVLAKDKGMPLTLVEKGMMPVPGPVAEGTGSVLGHAVEQRLSVYADFLLEFAQSSSQEDQKDDTLKTNQNAYPGMSIESEPAVYASTPKEAFEQYIEVFTNAVNTGDTDKMDQVLDADSEVYKQQCNLVINYYKRGIREEVKSISVTSVRKIGVDIAEVDSKEKIKVFYENHTFKVVKQMYCYSCERIDGKWVITKMEDI